MIGRLRGTLISKIPPLILIDVQGVGYEVEAPMSTFYQLPELEQQVILHTHLIVREDAQFLCGFATESERHMFRSLIRVNGVGAKLALGILSGMGANDFAVAIQQDDVKTLTRLPGVGKKTAERLIIEMRDKVEQWQQHETNINSGHGATTSSPDLDPAGEAVSALTSLGYKPQEASKMVRMVSVSGLNSEQIIREALKSSISQ